MSRKRASPADRAVTEALVRAVRAAFALESGEIEAVEPPVDFAHIDPSMFGRAVKIHQVSPLLDEHAAALCMPSELADEMHQLARAETLKAMTLAQETVRAWSTLTQAGIPALVMKGVALSMQTTGRPTSRGDGDIDLLVAPEDVPHALEVLTDAGWNRRMPRELSEDWWPWYSRVNRETPLPGLRSDVDLHWRVTHESQLMKPTHVLLERSDFIEIGGERVRVLNEDDRLFATCYAFQLDRFSSLRLSLDVARLVRKRIELPSAMPRRLRRMVEESIVISHGQVGGTPREGFQYLALVRKSGRTRVRTQAHEPMQTLVNATAPRGPRTRRSNRTFLVPSIFAQSFKTYRFDTWRWTGPFRAWLLIVLTNEELRPALDRRASKMAMLLTLLESVPDVVGKRSSQRI